MISVLYQMYLVFSFADKISVNKDILNIMEDWYIFPYQNLLCHWWNWKIGSIFFKMESLWSQWAWVPKEMLNQKIIQYPWDHFSVFLLRSHWEFWRIALLFLSCQFTEYLKNNKIYLFLNVWSHVHFLPKLTLEKFWKKMYN